MKSRSASAPEGLWPVLKTYRGGHLAHIAMPIGGIGTGTVSLGGRGNLRDWEIMNRPAKGFSPDYHGVHPAFFVRARRAGAAPVARIAEGPLPAEVYEGASGSLEPNHGFPRFRDCEFRAAYPLAQVRLSDPSMPVRVAIEAFNPLIPGDADDSGWPVAVLRFRIENRTAAAVEAAVCGVLPNFIGQNGSAAPGTPPPENRRNRNAYRSEAGLSGVFLDSEGVDAASEFGGTMALATTAARGVSHRTDWAARKWGGTKIDFWDDLLEDGALDERGPPCDAPMASLAVRFRLAPRASRDVTFLMAWHFPNRMGWMPEECDRRGCPEKKRIGNHYATRFADAWDAARRLAPRLRELEARTVAFVRDFCSGDLPAVAQEAALFNVSTLRSQTCFRTPDGRLFGWEGCNDRGGCCPGSCTHVWNYEFATPFLFGDLAWGMREVEFGEATNDDGHMAFRVCLPTELARGHASADALAAADGQMGCIMKAYRDWQLAGGEPRLRALWPRVRKALEFCWVPGGWDADRDGVMEGCQHNTMDVEYYGPNPQMQTWYLGALRAAEEMARAMGEGGFAEECHGLFERGRAWTDAHLFNGEYYEHEVRPPKDASAIAPGLRSRMGAEHLAEPELQLAKGCLVDQLVGQYMARLMGLGDLLDPAHMEATLSAILRHNGRRTFFDHFNPVRSFTVGDEPALLMAAYPRGRPAQPFPYYAEVMTGFEYVVAVHLLCLGRRAEGLNVIRDIRARYDGRKRSPFDEAECGHHYARAMASWGAVLAWSGFRYSAVDRSMAFAGRAGRHFWSNGRAWGTCRVSGRGRARRVELAVTEGTLELAAFRLEGVGATTWKKPLRLGAGRCVAFAVGPVARA